MRQRLAAKRRPFPVLPKRFRVAPAPTLQFGLTFTEENIMQCALKHNLISHHLTEESDNMDDEAIRLNLVADAVMEYLERTLQVPLFMPAADTPGQLGMFALYSNHNIRRYQRRKTLKSTLESMRQELGVEGQRSAWYWDLEYDSRYVTRSA